MTKPRLFIVPCDMGAAKRFVAALHRHHSPPLGGKFAIAVADEAGAVRGVAIVGRPVSRMLDDGFTLEVTRVATDGADNACSALYGAARRAAWALGFRRLVTYTLPSEGGASLRAAGFAVGLEDAGGGSGLARRALDVTPNNPTQRSAGSRCEARRGSLSPRVSTGIATTTTEGSATFYDPTPVSA